MTCSWVSCKHDLLNFSSYPPASFMLSPRSCAKGYTLLLAKASLLALLLMAVSFFCVAANCIEAIWAQGWVDPASSMDCGVGSCTCLHQLPLAVFCLSGSCLCLKTSEEGVLNSRSTALPSCGHTTLLQVNGIYLDPLARQPSPRNLNYYSSLDGVIIG